MPKQAAATPKTSLVRELGLFDATAIVIGVILGSGIFLVPKDVATQLDSLFAVSLAWIVGGVLSLFGALSLSEMGAAFPSAGGLYVYLSQAYGRPAGFLYGWGLFTAIQSGSIATLAVAFSLYTAQLIPVGYWGQKAIAIACILGLTFVNCRGVRSGKLVQNLFTVAKMGGLAIMIILLFAQGHPMQMIPKDFWPRGGLAEIRAGAFGVALVAVLWAYEGWHVVSFAAAEMKDPQRTLPKSLIYGTVIILAAYMLANFSYYSVLTRPEMAHSSAVAATAVTQAAGATATSFLSILILVSVFGAVNGMVLTGPRVYYAMAEDGLFFKAFGKLHPRFRTPIVAIVAQGIWASLLTLIGNFEQLFSYVIFTAWIFYGATVAGVIVLRQKQPHLERPFKTPAYPWLPLVFALAAAGITLNTILETPGSSLYGIAFILTGVPGYLAFRALSRK
jgi:basic amino acid/polyamine antiporter, APA family